MQPPSEADIIAATKSLEVHRDLKQAQIAALLEIQECLRSYTLPVSSGAIEASISVYLGHCITEHRLVAEVLEAQIAYNKRVLEAARSSILLPSFGPRKLHERGAGSGLAGVQVHHSAPPTKGEL